MPKKNEIIVVKRIGDLRRKLASMPSLLAHKFKDDYFLTRTIEYFQNDKKLKAKHLVSIFFDLHECYAITLCVTSTSQARAWQRVSPHEKM